MAGPAEFGGPPRQLRPDQVPLLLNTIDKLRSMGVGEIVKLPQMIICGSKANAKRSVIESISRIRFPVRKDFYNGFVTEITLRRHAITRFQVSVEPGPSSSKSDLDIQELKASMLTAPNAEQSVSLIEKATGFVKPSLEDGFSEDVMRVELSGPDQPNLTLIDIPRLYFTEGIDAEHKEKCAGRLQIEKYVRNPRTIILAVVSAKIDICAQKINDFADKYDRGRNRILGIITHLDTLDESSDEEKLWQMAVKEEISQQRLGLHLVWTRSSETRDVPDEQRDQKEKEFFERGDWKTVPRESVGTDNLRSRLSTLLVNHVQRSLSKLVSEINQRTQKIQSSMAKLRTPRETIHQQKALLFNLGSDFHRITEQALTGMYFDDFFATRVDDGQPTARDPRRLRALIHALNEDFADIMDIAGCRQFIHGVNNQITSLLNPCNPYANIRQPDHKSRLEFELDVLELMCRDRGLEFPGNISPLVVANLFRDQSEPWEEIAGAHVKKSWETSREFVSLLLDHLTDEHMSAVIMRTVIQPQFDRMLDSLQDKVHELTAAYKRGFALPLGRSFRGHPLPLDRSFLARMQKSRNDRVLAHLQQNLPSTFSNTYTMGEIQAATQNMESSSNPFVASDIIDQFQAYYNNALGIFMDNITTLGIENCLLDPLNDLLTTRKITELEDSQIEDLFAGVHNGVENQGHDLGDELQLLQTAVRALDQFKIAPSIGAIKPPGLPSAHGRSSLQPYLIPQGIICNGASANPFGVLCVDSRVQGQNNTPRYQISWPYSPAPDMQNPTTPCPSGPFGLNPGTMNPGTVSAPTVSVPIANAAPSASGVPGFAGPTPPLPQTFTSSSLWSPRAGPGLFCTPDTSGHDANSYWEEKDHNGATMYNRYYSICCHEKFKSFSPEELRWADYKLGRQTPRQSLFGPGRDAEQQRRIASMTRRLQRGEGAMFKCPSHLENRGKST
ncbi:hypothetical protein PENFLA_c010G03015 [Penicillium flavigenum]|uniref:GED domain-containing protein n=1 Tax=Penicillium flavigenum TaxID=254877 RepID=A0A1V6TCG1_9EURO|nr:hypothetical protein PENFLA_c010G03015 [Penicillium flavigenum]